MDTIERKKSLRILAGIFLLIGLVLGLAVSAFSYLTTRGASSLGFFQLYWLMLLLDLIQLVIVIFIFRRVYLGAGIAEGVLALRALLNVASALLSLVRGPGRDMSSYYIGSAALNLLTVAVAVLFMIGFLKHNRSSKGLFILGAILQFVASLLSSVLPYVTVNAGYANATMILSTLGGGLFLGSFTFLGWLFLGLYFGAQTDGAAQTASTYSDPISHDI